MIIDTGMEDDPPMQSGTTGMYHAGARFYHPGLQRFISEDPERGEANLFSYAGDNPIMNADPSGMDTECVQGGCYGTNYGESGGYNAGNQSLAELLNFLLNWLQSMFSTPSAAAQPPPLQTQRKLQNSKTFEKTGSNVNADMYSQKGCYNSMEDAAMAAYGPAMKASKNDFSEEYGGFYPNGRGYSFNGPIATGNPNEGKVSLPGLPSGMYHTHPFPLSDYEARTPSPPDIADANALKGPNYIFAPGGMYRVDPQDPKGTPHSVSISPHPPQPCQ